MRRVLLLIVLAGGAAACGSDSPTAPTTPQATISRVGNITIDGCVQTSATRFSCSYHGIAQNTGPGCAANVRGIVKTFLPNDAAVLGASAFTYAPSVRVGEQFIYSGVDLTVPDVNGWTFDVTFGFDSVLCQ